MSTMVDVTTMFGYKITVLLLCLRLFGVNKNFRYITWALVLFVFGYLFSDLLTEIFGCVPIPKAYQPEIPGYCIDSIKAGLVYGSMNIASDLFIFALPLPMVWRLQLTIYEKLGVSFIFMNGAKHVLVLFARLEVENTLTELVEIARLQFYDTAL